MYQSPRGVSRPSLTPSRHGSAGLESGYEGPRAEVAGAGQLGRPATQLGRTSRFGWRAAQAARAPSSDFERGAAAAGRAHVRVPELETRAVGALDVVDFRLIEVLKAQRIHVQLH